MLELAKEIIIFLYSYVRLFILAGIFFYNFITSDWSIPSWQDGKKIETHILGLMAVGFYAESSKDLAWAYFLVGMIYWLFMWLILSWIVLELKNKNSSILLKTGKITVGIVIGIVLMSPAIIVMIEHN